MAQPSTQVAEKSQTAVSEPPKYACILMNDDYTTMEFVIEVLQKFFKKTYDEAMGVMLLVHHEGQGVAGIYPHDIAETKAAQVVQHAKKSQFPLQCKVEKV